MKPQKHSHGFTLLELMIVVAIVGILASIAMPAYTSFMGRAQLAESMTIVTELKVHVIDHYKRTGTFPVDNEAAGIPAPDHLMGNYVRRIVLEDGAFHVELGNRVNQLLVGKTMSIRPIVVTESPMSPVSWVCGYSSAPDGMTEIGLNKTDIERLFLPGSCI